jgi:hypothetical protein
MSSSNSNDDATRRRRREQRARRALERRREQAIISETLGRTSSGGATMEQMQHLLALVLHGLLEELAKPDAKRGYLSVARKVLYDHGIVCDGTASREELRERLMKLH